MSDEWESKQSKVSMLSDCELTPESAPTLAAQPIRPPVLYLMIFMVEIILYIFLKLSLKMKQCEVVSYIEAQRFTN